MFNPSLLPDVTNQQNIELPGPLQWVGMEKIAIPMLVPMRSSLHQEDANLSPSRVMQQVNVQASLFVDIDKADAKGIHMSRLHLGLNAQLAGQTLTKEKITTLLRSMVHSQEGISRSARLVLAFDLVIQKPALLSGKYGFQSYSVEIDAQLLKSAVSMSLNFTIPYSSTCPCSASLARQLYAQAINEQFSQDTIDKSTLMDWVVSEAGSIATPHSQRSYAYLKLQLINDYLPDLDRLVFEFENIIGTPVQTAVKRQDEQAFAQLNAENLMFCEDAARRIKGGLERMHFVEDYWFKVEHQESLHAHNAVVIDAKHSPKNQ